MPERNEFIAKPRRKGLPRSDDYVTYAESKENGVAHENGYQQLSRTETTSIPKGIVKFM